jgi:hypothetical protein
MAAVLLARTLMGQGGAPLTCQVADAEPEHADTEQTALRRVLRRVTGRRGSTDATEPVPRPLPPASPARP